MYYYGGYQGTAGSCGCGNQGNYGYSYPMYNYGCGYGNQGGYGYNSAIILVLFILLVIIIGTRVVA